MKHYILTILAVVAVAFVGCKNNPFNDQEGTNAYISFDINSIDIDVEAGTKAVAIPAIDDFTITITAQGAPAPSHTFLYKERPSQPIRLEAGEYVFNCFYGDVALQASATPVYNETKTLALVGAIGAQTVTFNPKRTHYCFEVVYPVGFDQHYADYKVAVASSSLATNVDFGGNTGSSVYYFKLGAAYTATLVATKKSDNSAVNIVLADVVEGEAKTYHQLNLLFPAPRFTSLAAHAITETVAYETSTDITFVSTSVISSAQMTVNFTNTDLIALNGSYTLDASTIASLATQGIECEVNANDGKISIAQGVKDKFLSFGNVNTDYTINVTVTDVNNRATTSNIIYTVAPPVFDIPDMRAAFWTKTFDGSTLSTADVISGTPSTVLAGLSYKISSDGANWSVLTPNNGKLYLDNLIPNTDYTIAATYRDITVTRVFKTEEQRQIPNNTFATNHSSGYNCYWFFANGAAVEDQWWGTRNGMTTSEGNNNNYSKYSGARSSSDGVELVTCGWGSGNTASGNISTIKNVTAGAIFLGSMNSSSENHGKSFTARPTALMFDYKYSPYNNGDKYRAEMWLENRDGSTVTKLAEIKISDGTRYTSWTNKTLTLTYSNTELPITHLCVAFYSGVNENSKDYVSRPGFASTEPSRGSVFNVNNVTLIYDK